MKRRNFLGVLAAVGAGGRAASAPPATAAGRISTAITRLELRHTWTTTMASDDFRDTLYTTYSAEGITGHGEGAPIIRYHENAKSAQEAVQSVARLLETSDPLHFAKIMAEVFRRVPGEWAGKAAIDIALMDWVGQKLGVPLYRYFGLDPRDTPLTTFSIGIDTPAITRQKTLEAADYPVLKVKVGLATDEPTIAAIRGVTRKPLRVDANEGWKDKEEAVRKINWLEKQGVEFIEQPLPAEMIEETRWVRARVHIPVIADEACQRASDIPRLAGAFDGVNVKLDKAGGMLEACRMIQIAKALGMKTMLGCMVSSSVSVTAAAHLSPLVDYADLDGNLLIANDPYRGVLVEKGKLVLPDRPGLGLVKSIVMRWAVCVLGAVALAACRHDHYGLVDVHRRNPNIVLEIRYAGPDNFTRRALYDRAECWLNAVAAARLDAVERELEPRGLRLKVWDCYRPLSVQKKFWALVPDERYVANPAKGSRHNRGAAVDLTLVRGDGTELPMPTPHDDFTMRAHRDFMDLPPEVVANRALLEKVMAKHGFVPFPTEWWHFDSEGWEAFPVMDVDFSSLR